MDVLYKHQRVPYRGKSGETRNYVKIISCRRKKIGKIKEHIREISGNFQPVS